MRTELAILGEKLSFTLTVYHLFIKLSWYDQVAAVSSTKGCTALVNEQAVLLKIGIVINCHKFFFVIVVAVHHSMLF